MKAENTFNQTEEMNDLSFIKSKRQTRNEILSRSGARYSNHLILKTTKKHKVEFKTRRRILNAKQNQNP